MKIKYADGNNIDCHLSFIPTMSAQRLLNGYRSILKRIYAPDAYYERVGGFWSTITLQIARAGRSPNTWLCSVPS